VSRIRTIKPEWAEDEQLADAGTFARLLSVGLIVLADDHGRGRANEVLLAAKFFHTEPDPVRCVRDGLARLSRIAFVSLYSVRGQRYYEVRNWKKHQRVDKPGKPRFPGPEEADDVSGEHALPTSSGEVRDSLAPDRGSRIEDRRSESGTGELAREGPSPNGSKPPTLAALGDEIRAGVILGFEDIDQPPPRETKSITWPGWQQLAEWVREKARMLGEHELGVARHLVRCFIRSPKAATAGWPIRFLVQNPAEFWREELPSELST
jgi:hypothetical protein